MIYFKKPDGGDYLVAIDAAKISAITQESREGEHNHPRTRLHFGGTFIDVRADMDQACRAIEAERLPIRDWISTRNEPAHRFLRRVEETITDRRDSEDLRLLADALHKARHPLHVYDPGEA